MLLRNKRSLEICHGERSPSWRRFLCQQNTVMLDASCVLMPLQIAKPNNPDAIAVMLDASCVFLQASQGHRHEIHGDAGCNPCASTSKLRCQVGDGFQVRTGTELIREDPPVKHPQAWAP